MGYWKSKVVPTMKKLFERSPTKKAVEEKKEEVKPEPVEEKSREVQIVEEVVKTEEPAKQEETKPEEITSGEKEIEIVEEKKEEVKPAPVPAPAAVEEKKKPAAEEDKKVAVEVKEPAVEEKKPVEEVKKEVVAAAPVAQTPSTKVTESPPAGPQKA